MFDAELFAVHGLTPVLARDSLSIPIPARILCWLDYQAQPKMEDKVVRSVQWEIFDVAVDIRPGSSPFGHWFGVELSAENMRQLYIPAGFANEVQSLVPDTVVAYHISVPFDGKLTSGLRHDARVVGVVWPLPPRHLSDRDQALPTLVRRDHPGLIPFVPASPP